MTNNKLNELREKFPRAAFELDLLSGRVDRDTGELNPNFEPDELQDHMECNVLEILDVIAEQGHSGFSHGYLLNLLIPLLKGMPITPLTGKEWEWGTGTHNDHNWRCSKIFRREDGTAYNIDGRVFSDNGGASWYSSIESRKDVTFPCSWKDLEPEFVIVDEGDKK